LFGKREACPALVNGSIPARRPGGSVAEGRYLADEETIHYGIILDLARQCDEYRSMADARYLARIFRVQVQRNAPPPPPVVRQVFESGPGEPDGSGGNGAPRKPRPATAAAAAVPGGAAAKIGRNDPCWCGSGQKYKKCHGR